MSTRKQKSVRRKSVENEELDSPTILKLIRELDNDLLETTSKVTTRNWAHKFSRRTPQFLTSKTFLLPPSRLRNQPKAKSFPDKIACAFQQSRAAREARTNGWRPRSSHVLYQGDKSRSYRKRKSKIARRARNRERLTSVTVQSKPAIRAPKNREILAWVLRQRRFLAPMRSPLQRRSGFLLGSEADVSTFTNQQPGLPDTSEWTFAIAYAWTVINRRESR